MRTMMAALFGLMLFFAAIGDAGADDAIQIERLAVEQRLKIRSWHVVVDSTLEFFHPDEKDKSETVKYVYYADSDRNVRRRDVTQSKRSRDNNPAKQIVTKEVWSDHYYRFCDEIYVNSSAEEMVQPVRVDAKDDIPAGVVPPIDVRLVGFSPTGLLFDRNVTDTVGNTDSFRRQGDPSATFKSVADESFDGIPCKKTVWVFAKGRTITTWIAPSLGFTPICMEYRSDKEEICRTTVQVKRYKETEIWFPTSSIFEEYDKGELTARESLTITAVSLNEPLDTGIFTLGGLAIPTGWPASYLNKCEDNYVWNGKDVVTEREAAYGHLLEGKSPKSAVNTVLVILGLLLISLACGLKFLKK